MDDQIQTIGYKAYILGVWVEKLCICKAQLLKSRYESFCTLGNKNLLKENLKFWTNEYRNIIQGESEEEKARKIKCY